MVVAVLKDGPVIWVFYDGGMITFGMTEIETRMEISEACMTPAEVWWSSASAVYRLVKGTGEWNEITNDRCEVIALLYDGTAMIRVLENGTVVWFSSSGDHTTKVLPDQSIVAATLLSVNGESTLITVDRSGRFTVWWKKCPQASCQLPITLLCTPSNLGFMTPPYISAVCACYAHERSFVAFGSANGAVGWLEVVMGWAGKKRVFVIKRHPTWLDTQSLKNSMVTFLGQTGTTLLVGAARQGMYYFDWSHGVSPHVTRLDPLPDVNDCVVAHDKLLIGTTDGIKISTFALQPSELLNELHEWDQDF